MKVVTGAMGSLLPKLGELLTEEYNLQKSTKKDVESLMQEMKSMHAALRKVAEVPRDQLDGQLKLWADDVRELSYNMEDVVDKFLVRVDGSKPDADGNKLKILMEKMGDFFRKGKTRHQIASAIKEIKKDIEDVANRRDRYNVENIEAMPRVGPTIDPRLRALYTEVTKLAGIHGQRDQELLKLLSMGSEDKLKIVSVVGFGGLGKTTLAKAVYDKIKGDFDCQAFVPVGRNPDVKKVLRDILIDLKYSNPNLKIMDERQLIDELQKFLEEKRYLIIIDDIWDEELWEVIKLAFSTRNNLGSRLITTTRIASVSESCCSPGDGLVYQMKPLSEYDSSKLFYKRIFSSENGCPSELEEVSREILKKCGGVPLAIITIASLLASDHPVKPKINKWHALLRSIGRGLTEDASLKEMQRILSFSYYDLPSHLKTCLLYLSIYPEDWFIPKDPLIWKWVAESFVMCKQQERSLFELGETYFSELINRSMIQPVYDYHGTLTGCRVHDMVLDLICSLSDEEKFIIAMDGTENTKSSKGNFRRLSLQSTREEDQQSTHVISSMSMFQVRSVTIFPPAINVMPALSSFDVLRVLDMRNCNLLKSGSHLNLGEVRNLFHLRYLGLRDIGLSELPKEIGNLQFLQVLDVGYNYGLKELPSTINKLRRLMCLHVRPLSRFPDGLGNLTSMEVLKTITASLNIVRELGNLTRLRELEIRFDDCSLELEKAFVESISKMHNIQSLILGFDGDFGPMDILGENWVSPSHFRRFDYSNLSTDANAFSALPAWIRRNPLHLSGLSILRIFVKELRQEDVQILGRLPALRVLWVRSPHRIERRLVIGADGFRSMIDFTLRCDVGEQIVFQQRALPKAKFVSVKLRQWVANEDFNLGLANLVSLRNLDVDIYCDGFTVGEAKKAEAAVRSEAKAAVRSETDAHPYIPNIIIRLYPWVQEGAHDDDVLIDDQYKKQNKSAGGTDT